MITSCPACRTAFRISQEQLAAREGRVRCGRCATVFDAREALQTEAPVPAPDTGEGSGEHPAQTAAVALPDPEHTSALPPAAPEAGAATPESVPAPIAEANPEQEPVAMAPQEADSVFAAAEPKRARHRAGWVAGGVLLALTLMIQIAFHYRGEIVLLLPELRPTLAELCTRLACDIPLPRRAELISIESSDLQADAANPNVMVLTATLRNRAAFAQSYPSLELTLTDTQEQPLARRVLGVKDYIAQRAILDTGFPANSEMPLKVYMEASSLKATGYRLYLFFP